METTASHKGVQLWEDGPVWAETNVGADSPEDYGLYFRWGDTIGYRWENDAWVASNGSVDDCEFSEETTPTYGKEAVTLLNEKWITEGGILSLNHDAARVHWGEGWRMPTDEDIDALVEKCDWTWTTQNGVAGYVVRGKGDFEEASIFIPAAGYGFRTWLAHVGSRGFVWSSVPDSSDSDYAWRLYFDSDTHSVSSGGHRNRGRSIRPVRDTAE